MGTLAQHLNSADTAQDLDCQPVRKYTSCDIFNNRNARCSFYVGLRIELRFSDAYCSSIIGFPSNSFNFFCYAQLSVFDY